MWLVKSSMDTRLEGRISQRLEQRLGLSLKTQQALKILQLNTMELCEELESIAQENPLLEIERDDYILCTDGDSPIEDPTDEEPPESIYMRKERTEDEGWDFDRLETDDQCFEDIVKQIGYLVLDQNSYSILEGLLDSIDEHGILKVSIKRIAGQLSVSREDVIAVIEKMRECGFDGLFSRSKEEMSAQRDDGYYPTSGYGDGNFTKYVEPDVFVEYVEKRLVISVRDIGLALSVDDSYKSILENAEDTDAKRYLEKKMNEAVFFVNALERRKETLIAIAREIVSTNVSFLMGESQRIAPLIMVDVATKLDLSVSTISRAVKDKYISTPNGVFAMRKFFGNTDERERAMEIIAKQLKEAPEMSDADLVRLLKTRGIRIARRTANKYRNQLRLSRQ